MEENKKKWVSLKEAEKITGISRSNLRVWLMREKISGVKIGAQWTVDVESIYEWVNRTKIVKATNPKKI